MLSTASFPASAPLPTASPSTAPNTNLSLLHLCTHLHEAAQVHALMIKSSQVADPYSAGRLAAVYALLPRGNLYYAEKILNSFSAPPTFICNTLMRAYSERRNPLKSLKLYHRMLVHGVEPEHFTFTFALKACTQLGALTAGTQIHAQVIKRGLDLNAHVRNKLIHLYAAYGHIQDASKVFDASTGADLVAWNSMLEGYAGEEDDENLLKLFNTMPARDVVSWNTMIAYYVEAGELEEAVAMFRLMQESGGCEVTGVTLVSLLSAVAQMGALGQGKWVHAYIERHGIELDENLSSALINMYSKCGCIEGAVYTFDKTHQRNVDTWNSMITGFTTNGHSLRAVELFSELVASGLMPNTITFMCVLNACSHGGFVNRGIEYFDTMRSVYGIEPDVGHYGCMVDLFVRAGLFDKAEEIMHVMPIQPDEVMWKAIVGACRIHKNYELGEKAGLELIEMAPDDNAGYVLLSNIYAMSNNWNGVHKVRKLMQDRGVRKVPGCSSVELDGLVHEFIAGDATHVRKKEVYEMLDEMAEKLKLAGYEPDTTQVLLDIEEVEVKESSLSLHSEKLAVAFGLISSRPGAIIRVVKNLRMCADCHSALKLLSEIYDRNIIVRDANRFHNFKRGSCSCMDYW